MPVEVDVDSDVIELVADDRPVDVEVDSEATELSVELRPVDSELMPVEVEVDSDVIVVADEAGRRGGRQRRDRAVGRAQAGRAS
jgi:hypothetical protein